jgi:hypothetical protein
MPPKILAQSCYQPKINGIPTSIRIELGTSTDGKTIEARIFKVDKLAQDSLVGTFSEDTITVQPDAPSALNKARFTKNDSEIKGPTTLSKYLAGLDDDSKQNFFSSIVSTMRDGKTVGDQGPFMAYAKWESSSIIDTSDQKPSEVVLFKFMPVAKKA